MCLALFKEALKPEQISAVLVDNGFMRTGEIEKVEKDIFDATGVTIRVIRAGDNFLKATTMYAGQETLPLKNVTDPEEKRAIIGDAFVAVRNSIADEGILRSDFLLGM